jgi:ubiquinone/menaquinone biosynthesis C-methylase UbiE
LRLYRYFLDSVPYYLARYYWWAYLWRPAIWFFDHQVIINAILFGQYKALMHATLARLESVASGNILQLTCVYGRLTPNLIARVAPRALHVADVAPAQLELARSKQPALASLFAARMNAECLGYRDNAFSIIVIFFLLHEMPPEARRNTLSECMRVLSSGGTLLFTEYAPLPLRHFLYRITPIRFLLTRLEPFLESFWQEDILSLLREQGRPWGKSGEVVAHTLLFDGFYRVTEYRIVNVDKPL